MQEPLPPFPFGSCEWEEEDELAYATAAESGWTLSVGRRAQTRWQTLDMSYAGLRCGASDAAFAGLARFANVTALFLSFNRALGALPDAVTRMPQLRCLHAADCGLRAIPPGVARLQQLRELNLAGNALRTLPVELGRLWRLLQLDLSGNPLESPPPHVLRGGPLAIVEFLRDRAPDPPPPPVRAWRSGCVGGCEPLAGGRPLLRVLTYNVLAEAYATPEQYAYCPSWALKWGHRQDLILREIAASNADVVCLQELEGARFRDFFQPQLHKQGYGSVFRPKSRARTKENPWAVDGCAIFFRLGKLRLVEETLVEYQSVTLARFHDLRGDRTGLDRLMLKDNIAVAGLFEFVAPTPTLLVVANTHIHWDPSNSDLKLMQVQFMLEELAKLVDAAKASFPGRSVAVVVAGDFNATPDSGVYQLLRDGKVPPTHPDFNGSNFGPYTSPGGGLQHVFPLRSAYASSPNGDEPEYTNHSGDFTGVLDYIWYTSDSIRLFQTLDVVPLSTIEAMLTPLPNPHFPSDHVSLIADFQLR